MAAIKDSHKTTKIANVRVGQTILNLKMDLETA